MFERERDRSSRGRRLWLVRHGESAGNVAAAAAAAAGLPEITIEGRDVDVPLSPVGEQQARALGRWFGAMAADARPTLIYASPYRRARDTAAHLAEAIELGPEAVVIDERLREKELGALNRLTKHGIRARFPEEVARREALGKFYYRPPGGESWCDVLLRLRAALDSLSRPGADERVLVVSHQVVVICARYLLERLDERQLLAIDREHPIPNCSVTSYDLPAGPLPQAALSPSLVYYVAPLAAEDAPITVETDATRAPK